MIDTYARTLALVAMLLAALLFAVTAKMADSRLDSLAANVSNIQAQIGAAK